MNPMFGASARDDCDQVRRLLAGGASVDDITPVLYTTCVIECKFHNTVRTHMHLVTALFSYL